MADIKWIKLDTALFDNRKIKHLRRLSGGNDMVLLWIMLLTIAGRCNSGGVVFLTESIPYSLEMLADELGFKEGFVKRTLIELERLEMIYIHNDFIVISGWEEHQNIEKLEKIKEQTKERVARHRKKQKEAMSNDLCNAHSNADVTLLVTQCNAIEEEKEKDINISTIKAPPTLEEVEMEVLKKGLKVKAEAFLAYYSSQGWIKSNGLPVTDWRAELQLWSIREGEKKTKASKNQSQKKPSVNDFTEKHSYDLNELRKKAKE